MLARPRIINVTALPKPAKNNNGVYHFPEDGCCLLTLHRDDLQAMIAPGLNINTLFPASLNTATRFAIFYATRDNPVQGRRGLPILHDLPEFVCRRVTKIESIHLNVCDVQFLYNFVGCAHAGGVLNHVVANIQEFMDEERETDDIDEFIAVMNILTRERMDFDITVTLSADSWEEDMRRIGYRKLLGEMHKRRDMFIVSPAHNFPVDIHTVDGFLFQAFHERNDGRLHFVHNVVPRLDEDPGAKTWRAFDNLNFVEEKPFHNGPSIRRYFVAHADFVIFSTFRNLRNLVFRAPDQLPVFEEEVQMYLRKNVYIEGFGSADARQDQLARLWNATKCVQAFMVFMHSPAMANVVADIIIEV